MLTWGDSLENLVSHKIEETFGVECWLMDRYGILEKRKRTSWGIIWKYKASTCICTNRFHHKDIHLRCTSKNYMSETSVWINHWKEEYCVQPTLLMHVICHLQRNEKCNREEIRPPLYFLEIAAAEKMANREIVQLFN